MATIGTVRLINLTDKQRAMMVTTVIPLPTGHNYWPQSSYPDIDVTAVNAETTPGNQRCQVAIQGPLKNGAARFIRITFRAEIAAGVADSSTPGYLYYRQKDITITNDATAGITFAIHSQLVSDLAATTVKFKFGMPSGAQEIVMDLAGALQVGEKETETDPTKQRVRKFRALGRYFPANSSEPSLLGEFDFEIGHNQRDMPFTARLYNSLIQPDGGSGYTGVAHTFTSDVQLEIDSPNQKYLLYEDRLVPSVTINGNVWTHTLMDSSKGLEFPDGHCIARKGVMLANTGVPSGIEQDSLVAWRENKHKADLAISTNWGDTSVQWGAMYELPNRPTNSLISSDADGIAQMSLQAEADWLHDAGMRHPFLTKIMGSQDQPGVTAAYPDFGLFKLWAHCRAPMPDWRTVDMCCAQEWNRDMFFKELNGDLMDNAAHPSKAPQNEWSGLLFWESRPFFNNNSPPRITPNWADGLGKALQSTGPHPRGSLANENCKGYNQQHPSSHFLNYYALVTGDWNARYCVEHQAQTELATEWPKWDQGTFGSLAAIQSRADGRRTNKMMGHYLVTGDSRIPTNLTQRVTNVYVPNWAGGSSWGPVVKPFGLQGPDSRVLLATTYQPWQENIWMHGAWAQFLETLDITLLNMIISVCHSMCTYGNRKNSDSGNLWQWARAVQWAPYSNQNAGTPLLAVDEFDGRQDNNGVDYAVWGTSLGTIWADGLLYLGYELGVSTGDTVWAQKCIDMIKDRGLTEENSRGPLGWGGETVGAGGGSGGYRNNVVEWISFVPDIFKNRQLGTVTAIGRLNGASTLSGRGSPQVGIASGSFAGTSTINAAATVDDGTVNVYAGASVGGTATMTATATLGPTGLLAGTSDSSVIASVGGASNLSKIVLLGSVDFKDTFSIAGSGVTEVNQIFAMWAGNDRLIEYVVTDNEGNPVDLRAASDIQWVLSREVGDTPKLISKGLQTGGIVLSDSVTYHKFTVILTNADTRLLNGKYYHEAEVSVAGAESTVAVGHALIQPSGID